MSHPLLRAALAAALAAAATAFAQPVGPYGFGGAAGPGGIGQGANPVVVSDDRPVVERSSPEIGRDDALVPGASLGSLGRQQADVEADTCVIKPVMSDRQLRLCGATPPEYPPYQPKPAKQ